MEKIKKYCFWVGSILGLGVVFMILSSIYISYTKSDYMAMIIMTIVSMFLIFVSSDEPKDDEDY